MMTIGFCKERFLHDDYDGGKGLFVMFARILWVSFFLLLSCQDATKDSPVSSQRTVSVKPKPNQGKTADSMSAALWASSSIDTYLSKVDDIVRHYDASLKKRPRQKPLVLVLGSSSTGGRTIPNNMKFWPGRLQDKKNTVHIQSVAWGGATTWHMRKVVEKLNLTADICILYMGHNDMQEKSPRQTIAELEQGLAPTGYGFVSWVSLPEAKKNIEVIKTRCTQVLVMPEFSLSTKRESARYAKMLQTVSGVRFRDPRPLLERQDPSFIMQDDIHLTPPGHEMLADFVYNEIKDWL